MEVESANSYTVEETAATFTRRRINGIHGYMRCGCNSSKSGMHGCTHGYYTPPFFKHCHVLVTEKKTYQCRLTHGKGYERTDGDNQQTQKRQELQKRQYQQTQKRHEL